MTPRSSLPRIWRAAAMVLLAAVCSCSPDLRVKPARLAELTGTIRDPEGNVVPGAVVTLLDLGGANADSAGRFLLRAPEGTYGIYIYPKNHLGNFQPVVAGPVRVRAPVTHWDYTLAGIKVQGTVTIPGGAPLDSGSVQAYDPRDYRTLVYVPLVAGHYKMYLRPGVYTFFASPQFVVPSGLPQVIVPSVTVSADTTIDIALSGETVTGMVTLGPGVPMAGASVMAQGNTLSTTITRADGSYPLYAPDGDYDWIVRPGTQNGNVMPSRQLGPGVSGPTTLNFDLTGVRWSGTVRWSADAQPVPSINVTAQLDYDFTAMSTTDAAGHFDLIVRRGVRQTLYVNSPTKAIASQTFPGVLAGSDSTFDLLVSPPAP